MLLGNDLGLDTGHVSGQCVQVRVPPAGFQTSLLEFESGPMTKQLLVISTNVQLNKS